MLCFIMEFIGAIIICMFGVEESDILIKELDEVFHALINRMDIDERASRILKIVQEYVCIDCIYFTFQIQLYYLKFKVTLLE